MKEKHRIKFGLLCLVMAALVGLVGFVIVYHYTTFERPLLRFAIVIDAGSTQTRSSLYALQLEQARLDLWLQQEPTSTHNLSELVQVRHIANCINGGPMTGVESMHDAKQLVDPCLRDFALQVKRLNFRHSLQLQDSRDQIQEDEQFEDLDEIERRMAKLNRRVNSITRVYLGATAGMRALARVNSTAARQKVNWMRRAIDEAGQETWALPHLNRAFADIISGQDEASFGWISVNFLLNKLHINLDNLQRPQIAAAAHQRQPFYEHTLATTPQQANQTKSEQSAAILELGGASAQMAFELEFGTDETKTPFASQTLELDLFNSQHKLVARSDLCLGMSQAILRTDLLLLRDYMNLSNTSASNSSAKSIGNTDNSTHVEIINPCLQNEVQRDLFNVDDMDLPCLQTNETPRRRRQFLESVSLLDVRFVGTGNVLQCQRLLSRLISPSTCKDYFAICPKNKADLSDQARKQTFVTISGYNKALQALELHKMTRLEGSHLEQIVGEQLGGFGLEQAELRYKTRQFCETPVNQLAVKYPLMSQIFYPVNCLQLVYIDSMLSDFYQLPDWHRVKFLLWPPSEQSQEQQKELGWSLGLLLNATSQSLAGCPNQLEQKQQDSEELFYRHGATVTFIIRAVVLLMLASCLLAICLLLFGALLIRKRQHSGIYLANYYTRA